VKNLNVKKQKNLKKELDDKNHSEDQKRQRADERLKLLQVKREELEKSEAQQWAKEQENLKKI